MCRSLCPATFGFAQNGLERARRFLPLVSALPSPTQHKRQEARGREGGERVHPKVAACAVTTPCLSTHPSTQSTHPPTHRHRQNASRDEGAATTTTPPPPTPPLPPLPPSPASPPDEQHAALAFAPHLLLHPGLPPPSSFLSRGLEDRHHHSRSGMRGRTGHRPGSRHTVSR